LLTTFVEAFVVYLFVIRGLFRRFLFLNLYFLLLVGAAVGRVATWRRFGLASSAFSSFYFFSDGLLAIFLFLSICQLGTRLVGDLIPRRKIALFDLGLFVTTVCVSFPIVSSEGFLDATAIYADQLSRNLSLVCGLCIIALWAWKLRNNPSDWISAQLVNTLTVYFLLFALTFEGFQVAPRNSGLINVSYMIEAWLPLGCGFALLSPAQQQPD
jgi:hypothetical protein